MDLAPIERTDRGRSRLHAALRIYRNTILPEAQNPERQILYWIDHSKDNLSDEFRCFAIERAGKVVGYLQYSYFREEHIFFFEYLCIQDSRRKGLVPSNTIKLIEDYLSANYDPGFIIVFEVAHRHREEEWIPDEKLLKYFIRLGFRILDFEYRYPVLQSYDGATSYPADLMVLAPGGRKQITSSEMRTILRCIYFKHYLRWDRPFLSPELFRDRERLIDELYSREVSTIKPDDTFGTRGDDKRSVLGFSAERQRRLRFLLQKIFGTKLVKLLLVMGLLMVVHRVLDNTLFFIPFVLVAAAIYCLIEDTASSRKLFVYLVSKLSSAKLQA